MTLVCQHPSTGQHHSHPGHFLFMTLNPCWVEPQMLKTNQKILNYNKTNPQREVYLPHIPISTPSPIKSASIWLLSVPNFPTKLPVVDVLICGVLSIYWREGRKELRKLAERSFFLGVLGVTGISKVLTGKVTFEPGVGECVRFYYIEKCRRA